MKTKNKDFWRRMFLWFVPSKKRQCKGCCLFCVYFEDCYREIL